MPQSEPNSQRASPRSESPPINSVALYLMSLAGMIGLYSVYTMYAVPIIEGPPIEITRRVASPEIESASSKFDKTELTQYLPSDGWENDECKTLLTSQGTILFKDFERVKGGYLEVFPFTLITSADPEKPFEPGMPGDPAAKSQEPPTVLRCVRGARLKFDKPITESFSGKPKMESAQLVGQVNIYRPPSSPTADNGLRISTSNVQIEKQKVFTIEEVAFAIGRNQGRGKNLLIELDHDANVNEITGDFSSIRGIKRLELSFLKQLHLESDNSNDASGITRNSGNSANVRHPINISCAGPFVFDMQSQTATFTDRVMVQMENEYRDNITCDRLSVLFDERDKQNRIEQTKNDADESLSFRQLVAEGSPAIIFSAEREAKVSAERMIYNAIDKFVIAENVTESAAPVTVVSPDYHVVASKIFYRFLEPGSLGPIEAVGPGKLLKLASAKKASKKSAQAMNPQEFTKEFFVQWGDRLEFRPDPTGDQNHLIDLTGGAKIRLNQDTKIESDHLTFWLRETQTNFVNAAGKTESKKQFEPVRLIAEQNVVIDSPQLVGKTQRLTAEWSETNRPELKGRKPELPSSNRTGAIDFSAQTGFEIAARQLGSMNRLKVHRAPYRQDDGSQFNTAAQSGFVEVTNETDFGSNDPAANSAAMSTPMKPIRRDPNVVPAGFVPTPQFNQGLVIQNDGSQHRSNQRQMIANPHTQSNVQSVNSNHQDVNTRSQIGKSNGESKGGSNGESKGGSNGESKGGSKRNRKYSFLGDEVEVQLVATEAETKIKDLAVRGNVFIQEIESRSPGGMNIKGDFLRVIPQTEKQMRMVISGSPQSPATVVAKNLDLQGANIHLDQAANKLWVEGVGEMRLAGNLESGSNSNARGRTGEMLPSERSPKPPAANQNVNVSWAGGMIFDGSKVYFEEAVEMVAHSQNDDGSPVITRSSSGGLSLQLNQPIDFNELESESVNNGSRKIEIREAVIVDRLRDSQRVFKLAKSRTNAQANRNPAAPSIISNQVFDSEGNLAEQQKFIVSQATLNKETGTVNSDGPGVMMVYRVGENPMLARAAGKTGSQQDREIDARNNKESRNPSRDAKDNKLGLTLIRVNFDGSVNVNSQQQEMVIRGNVRTLYTPVKSFEENYDPDQSQLPNDSVKVTCEELKLAQWTPRNSTEDTKELIATGNAHIVSSTFEATADRLSYNQLTDILVVEGTPRSDAHLWFKQVPNAKQRDHLVAEKILFRIADKWTEVQGVKNLNIKR